MQARRGRSVLLRVLLGVPHHANDGDPHEHGGRIGEREPLEPRVAAEVGEQPFGILGGEEAMGHQPRQEQRGSDDRARRVVPIDRAQDLTTEIDVEMIAAADPPHRPVEIGERPLERPTLVSRESGALDLPVEPAPVRVRSHAVDERLLEGAHRLLLREEHAPSHDAEPVHVVEDDRDDLPVLIEEDPELGQPNPAELDPALIGHLHEPNLSTPFPVLHVHQNTACCWERISDASHVCATCFSREDE